jgi:D-glycero-alpha-D-manno-heptose-7-phosphate kinase
VCAVINRVKLDYKPPNTGFDIYLHSDAPPGAGLGTSSTVVVAVLGLFIHWLKLDLSTYEIAKLAWEIERQDMKMAGGKQDQYAAAFGGINLMYFKPHDETLIMPLKVPESTLLELQNNLLLVYSGSTHKSGEVIMSQTPNSLQKYNWILHIKGIAQAMVEDILVKDLENFAELLSMEWLYKKQLSSKVSNPHLEELANTAMEAGALGLKITGAGGGGMFLIYTRWQKKHNVVKAMTEAGCEVIDYSFRNEGLQTWSVHDE